MGKFEDCMNECLVSTGAMSEEQLLSALEQFGFTPPSNSTAGVLRKFLCNLWCKDEAEDEGEGGAVADAEGRKSAKMKNVPPFSLDALEGRIKAGRFKK